jgi:hypothetical protein
MNAACFAVLVVGMLGCGRSMAGPPKDKQEKPDPTKPSTTPISLDFTMKHDGGKLRVDYTLANHSKDSILVRDVMVTPSAVLAPTTIIAVRGASPSEVRFVRGDINPDSKVNIHYPAGVQSLAAGKTLTGSALVGLPLVAWHPYGEVQPLEGTPTRAVLEVQIYPASTAQETATLADGGTIHYAARAARPPDTLRAGPHEIP